MTAFSNFDQFQERSLYATLPLDLAKERMEYVCRAIDTGERQIYEYDIPIKGVIRHEEARIVAINDSEALIIVRDITEQHQFEQIKDEFISMVSHELRTPLTSIQVALSLLDEQLVDPSSEDGRSMLHVATEGVDRLTRLVNDILDLQRLESGRLRMKKQPCQTQDLIDTATQEMQDLANQAQVTITASGTSHHLQADPDRIVQVLTNLLSNAIRFSNAEDQVWVNVMELASDAAGEGREERGEGSLCPSDASQPISWYQDSSPSTDLAYSPTSPPPSSLLPPNPSSSLSKIRVAAFPPINWNAFSSGSSRPMLPTRGKRAVRAWG